MRLVDFEDLVPALKEADVIISSINRAEPFFTRELVEHLDVLSFKFFVDLSVPRSIASDVELVPGVLVYNIDAIQSKASAALQTRLAAVPQVRAIIAESIAGLQDWAKEMMVSPLIQKMKASLETLRQEEMDRYQKRATPAESKLLDEATRSLMQKILKQHVLHLKSACKRDEADKLVAMLGEMFDLEKQNAPA
jgi:glutamyl-tRNA reductase